MRYATSAEPLRVHICFCRFCQRATGSNAMVEPLFERPAHTVIHGSPATFSLASGGSGKQIKISFCNSCGTKLFQEFERFPTIVGVYAGTFDDPNWFDRSPVNTKYMFLEAAQEGTIIPAGFNTFHESHTLKDGTPAIPEIYDEPYVIKRR